MKKKHYFALILTAMLAFSGCSDNAEAQQVNAELTTVTETSAETTAVTEEAVTPAIKPEITQIRSICELATLECCYNNVAKSTKEPGTGLSHLGEKQRDFWIEYSGTAKIGIDMSELKMDITDENIITITVPKAKILSISVDQESYSEDSYVISSDNFIQKNPITADDQTKAINTAQEQIKSEFENNSNLMNSAQDRAQKLIDNYISQIGKATGAEYKVEWVFE